MKILSAGINPIAIYNQLQICLVFATGLCAFLYVADTTALA
jgi:hypothetical protein